MTPDTPSCWLLPALAPLTAAPEGASWRAAHPWENLGQASSGMNRAQAIQENRNGLDREDQPFSFGSQSWRRWGLVKPHRLSSRLRVPRPRAVLGSSIAPAGPFNTRRTNTSVRWIVNSAIGPKKNTGVRRLKADTVAGS